MTLFLTFQAIYSGCCTVRNVEGLHESIVAARAQGYALVDEEFGLVSVAAPAGDFKGQLVEALNVSAPKFHLGGRLEGADELSTLLCGSSGAPHYASMHNRSVHHFSGRLVQVAQPGRGGGEGEGYCCG